MGISLLSVPGKIYGRILNERMMKITDKSVGDKQRGFWKGRLRYREEHVERKGEERMVRMLT